MKKLQFALWQKILLAFCAAGILVSAAVLLSETRALIIKFGEALAHRGLNHSIWKPRLLKIALEMTLFFALGIFILLFPNSVEGALEKIPQKFKSEGASLAIVFSLSAICALLGFMNIHAGHNWGGDFSEYIADARNLATGSYNPNQPKAGYLYGTAIILLPFYALFGLNLFALKIPMIILYAGSVAFIGLFLKKRFCGMRLFFALALFALNPFMIEFLNNVLSDIPFLFFSSAAVFFVDTLYDENASKKKQIACACLSGFCTAFAKMCREEGAVLFLAFFCTEIILILKKVFSKNAFFKNCASSLKCKSGFVHAAFYAGLILTFFVLHFFVEIFPARNDMSHIANISIMTIAKMAVYHIFIVMDFFDKNILLWLFCIPFVALGISKVFFKEIFSVIYLSGIFAIHILWNGVQGLRFLFPALPFLVMFLVFGLEARKVNSQRERQNSFLFSVKMFCFAAIVLFASIGFFTSIFNGVKNIADGRKYQGDENAFSSEAMALYDFINENTGYSEAFIFAKPRVLFLNTFRGGQSPKNDMEGFEAQLFQCDYLLLSEILLRHSPLPKEFDISKEELEIVFKNSEFTLYKISGAPQ